MSIQSLLEHVITNPVLFVYQLLQWLLDRLLSPAPPPPNTNLSRPKIAIIGAGLTGVSAASHCVGHGFECVIFEAGSRKTLGGIWSVRLIIFLVARLWTERVRSEALTPVLVQCLSV